MSQLSFYLLMAPPILFALTIHEYAHGWVAYRFGDPTAKLAGRLTLNPLVHLDPLGTILLFVARIGWAKPVPVNPYYFRDPRRDLLWVSLAGPASNLLAAFAFGLVCRALGITSFYRLDPGVLGLLEFMLIFSVYINIILAVFNLIPVPPLDGSKILAGLLSRDAERTYEAYARYGAYALFGIILIEMVTGARILWAIIGPFVRFFSVLFVGSALA